MNGEIVVKAEGLGKRFKIYTNPFERVREWVTRRPHHIEFWALREVSFELQQGQILGILGPNGAGKSTLLKLLTGTLYPTTGAYSISGQVLSLLSLNTGFNPELTGRQNVLHSGQLLDLPRDYMQERLPEIEDFAELGEFFDRPVKFYSSGMRTRLGFSLFAFLDCSLLILDEILAVGDIFFKQKCYARLEALIEENTSIILVTHSMLVVQKYCHQALFLDQGQVRFQGDPSEAIRHYKYLGRQKDARGGAETYPDLEDDLQDNLVALTLDSPKSNEIQMPPWPQENAWLDLSEARIGSNGLARCTIVAICNESGSPCQVFEHGQWLYLYAEFEGLEDIGVPVGRYAIFDERNTLIHSRSTLQQGVKAPARVCPGDRLRFFQKIKLDLLPGGYTLRINLGMMVPQAYARAAEMKPHQVKAQTTILVHLERFASFIITPCNTGMALLHDGICNLPGASWLTVEPTDMEN